MTQDSPVPRNAVAPRRVPQAFSDLQPWADDWALPREKDRLDKLVSLEIEGLRPFYDAMLPRMPAIKDYLDRFPLDAMPQDAQTLFDLALTFMEMAHPIDLGWKITDIEDKFPHDRFKVLSRL
jgi:hypothetical protein